MPSKGMYNGQQKQLFCLDSIKIRLSIGKYTKREKPSIVSSTTGATAPRRGDGAASRCTGRCCSSTTWRIPYERWRQIFLAVRYFPHPMPSPFFSGDLSTSTMEKEENTMGIGKENRT